MKTLRFAILLAGFAVSSGSFGYELVTHSILTYRAFKKSTLSDSSVIGRFGLDGMLDRDSKEPFGGDYYELTQTGPLVWTANRPNKQNEPFDVSRMAAEPGFNPTNDNLTIPGWLMRGAIREDDDPFDSEPNPKNDEPSLYGDHRVVRHFFDPAKNRGMQVGVIEFARNPDWALGYTDAFAADLQADAGSRNNFSSVKFREAMFRALTLKQRLTNGTFVDLLPNGADSAVARDKDRKRYWATAFRAIGDAVHGLQDMAQPQHTRNDVHSGIGPYVTQPYLAGHKSVIENYVEARARGAEFFTVKNYSGGTKEVKVAAKTLAGLPDYPVIPRFPRASNYWAISPGSASRFGEGLADYSNRGFFTDGSNVGNTTYSMPNPASTAYSAAHEPVTAWDGTLLDSSIGPPFLTVLRGMVMDTLNSNYTEDRVALSAFSGWDPLLTQYSAESPKYNIFQVNYDDQIRLLLPRAISYSAGLIDHMLRGRMQISLPVEGVYGVVDHATASGNSKETGGFGTIKLRVENLSTKPDGTREEMSNGHLVAVARFRRNTCYQPDLSGEYGAPGIDWRSCRSDMEEIVSSNAVPVTSDINVGPTQYSFTFPARVPISATDLFLQVVFRGKLGVEPDAVVVETKDISEPTYAYNFYIWDQFKYTSYPFLNPGSKTFDEWCIQGFGALQPCYDAMGGTRKYQLAKDMDPIMNWDPAINPIPQGTWTDIAQEPAMPGMLFKSVTPALAFTRVAVLLDPAPANRILIVEESIDAAHGRGQFQWSTGQTSGAIVNQFPPYSTQQSPQVTYVKGRGIVVPDVEEPRLTGHSPDIDLATLPNFTIVPSQINF